MVEVAGQCDTKGSCLTVWIAVEIRSSHTHGVSDVSGDLRTGCVWILVDVEIDYVADLRCTVRLKAAQVIANRHPLGDWHG